MMNHMKLVYFLTTARELNFTKAAEKLYISQQALSSHIASIEKELGVVLLERKQPLKLTYAGTVFYRYAMELEECYRRMTQEMSDVREEKSGKITLGISHTRGRAILPRLLPAFMTQFPQVEVHILEGNTDEVTQALENGEIDLLVGQQKTGVNKIKYEKLLTEEVVLSISDRLLERYPVEVRQRIKTDLEKKGKISTMREMPFLLNKEGNATRKVADDIFQQEGIVPKILIETENIETLGDMCMAGIGAGFFPTTLLETTLNDKISDNLHIYRLRYSCTKIPFVIGYRNDCYMTRALTALTDIIRMEVNCPVKTISSTIK